jgi:ribonuclease P protein component
MAARCSRRVVPRDGPDWHSDFRPLPSNQGSQFPRCRRLLKPDEYRRVFNDGQRSADDLFLVLVLKNDLESARLGLAISKKICRLAVDRNRIKRVIRESFRHNQSELVGLDLVVVGRRGLSRADNQCCFESLLKHWQSVAEKCVK